MLGPFNNPGVDDSRLLRAVLLHAPSARRGRRRSPASSRPSSSSRAAGQRAECARSTRCGARSRKADPNLPLYFVGTPKAQLDTFVAQNRIIATMFSIFGVVAVVLASVGIYGVMSFSVNQRTQEFGVRMALGADDAAHSAAWC